MSEESPIPRRPREPETTFGPVRRLDSGPSPDRHPSVRWPDGRRPDPRRVENASTSAVDPPRGRLGARDAAGRDSTGAERPAQVALAEPRPHSGARRRRARRDGVEANARLTGSTAAVLLVLLAVEGLTILQIGPLLNVHVFVGMLLIPPVLLKIGSTSWRFVKYYRRDPEYRRKGPPAAVLRLLAPFVVVLTVVVLASGVALMITSPAWRTGLLLLHKVSFVLWFIAMTVHVLGHLVDTAKLAPRDWYWRTRRQIAGASLRQWALLIAIAVGLAVGAVMLPHVGTWFNGGHPPVSGVGHR